MGEFLIYTNAFYGGKELMSKKRIPFINSKDYLSVPNLVEHNIKSYEKFVNEYIGEVLDRIFPIFDRDTEEDSSYVVECMGYELRPPEISPREAEEKDRTYAANLYLEIKLTDKVMGNVVNEAKVYFGEIPYMTDSGSFISNGAERVIVSQITKSPSVYYDKEVNQRGNNIYKATIQPEQGTWIELETDAREQAHARIGNAKILLTTFLKALGIGDEEDMRRLYGYDNHILENTIKADKTETQEEALIHFFKSVRPGDPEVMERAKQQFDFMFGDLQRYDLEGVGRYKINEKLNKKERVLRKTLSRKTRGFEKGTVITEDVFAEIEDENIYIETDSGEYLVFDNGKPSERVLLREDVFAAVNYFFGLQYNIGVTDDIDHLSNRYLRLVGKLLQREFLVGMRRVEKNIKEYIATNASGHRRNKKSVTPENLAYVRPLESKFREFLGSSQLSQYVDQINPLSEISNKRRATAIGPGGFTKERAGVEARDVHSTHFARICPIETPEGASVGLINQLSVYAEVNEFGFLIAPYRKVSNGKVTKEIVRMTASQEEFYNIAEPGSVDDNGKFKEERVLVRRGEDYLDIPSNEVDYIGVSTKQPLGVGACCIPFLENDDAARVLMGANMQRQGLPSVNPEEPVVGTGLESVVARDTNASIYAKENGVVTKITNDYIFVKNEKGKTKRYEIKKFLRTNDNTCLNHYVKCYVGKKVKKDEILADSSSSRNGEIAVGQNALVAFLPMDGYNFEDSIVISDRLAKDDVFTNITIEEYKIEVKDTRLGPEEVSRDIPNVGENLKRNLDDYGIVEIGSVVRGGDILVGKKTPRMKEDKTPEDRLIQAIYSGKTDDYRDNSLRVEFGRPDRVVIDVIRNVKKDEDVKRGTIEEIKVLVAEKRKITSGDKMAGRHGNKGVVSIVLPEEDMPHLEDGTPVDIVLNPLGIPSRMNIGQIMEVHLGMVARELNVNFEVPVLTGEDSKEMIKKLLVENDMPEDGKYKMIDGRTGEEFKNKATVGVMYMMKLDHQVSDKIHARSTGPYSLVTQQPLGGKAQNGGQRLGEMEVWALEGYGAAHTLREMLTLKSDDFIGRSKLFSSIVKGQSLPEPNISESVKLLVSELRSLSLDTDIVTNYGKELLKPEYKPVQPVLMEEEVYEAEEDDEDSLIDEEEISRSEEDYE